MKSNYPVPSHFQFLGRDGLGTWKKVRDGSGTGIPSDPAPNQYEYPFKDFKALDRTVKPFAKIYLMLHHFVKNYSAFTMFYKFVNNLFALPAPITGLLFSKLC